MQERDIFHCDINHCYAQIEEMKYPALKEVPMAVGGHEESRHGIILAKNDLAKKCNVLTGESLREAKKKCGDLLIIPPAYDDYVYYTEQVKDIYREYSDCVESFGLDEAWVDYTNSKHLFGDPIQIACQIQARVKQELGLDISIGYSWNKVFAKLGSDLKQKHGPCVIDQENYQEVAWPLPVANLLYVGPATNRKLRSRAIYTIGDLAKYPRHHLKHYLGVAGEAISLFANGLDPTPVTNMDYVPQVKSIGNSITLVHDVHSLEEVKPVYYMLAESIASRLKDHGLEGDVLHVSIRTNGLDWYSFQKKLEDKTNLSEIICQQAMSLLARQYHFEIPLRSVGISLSGLASEKRSRQLSFFRNEEEYEKDLAIDLAMDKIRYQYGFLKVRRACTLVDEELSSFDAKGDHTIHPVGYFQGRSMSLK